MPMLGGQSILVSAQTQRCPTLLHHSERDALDVVDGLQVVEHHDELVATHPSDRVTPAHCAAQSLGHDTKELVAGGVAVRIVDAFEVVEIQEQERGATPVTAGASHGGRDPIVQQDPVREVRQRVVSGQMLELTGAVTNVLLEHRHLPLDLPCEQPLVAEGVRQLHYLDGIEGLLEHQEPVARAQSLGHFAPRVVTVGGADHDLEVWIDLPHPSDGAHAVEPGRHANVHEGYRVGVPSGRRTRHLLDALQALVGGVDSKREPILPWRAPRLIGEELGFEVRELAVTGAHAREDLFEVVVNRRIVVDDQDADGGSCVSWTHCISSSALGYDRNAGQLEECSRSKRIDRSREESMTKRSLTARLCAMSIRRRWIGTIAALTAVGSILTIVSNYEIGMWGAQIGAADWLESSHRRVLAQHNADLFRRLELQAERLQDSRRVIDALGRGDKASLSTAIGKQCDVWLLRMPGGRLVSSLPECETNAPDLTGESTRRFVTCGDAALMVAASSSAEAGSPSSSWEGRSTTPSSTLSPL